MHTKEYLQIKIIKLKQDISDFEADIRENGVRLTPDAKAGMRAVKACFQERIDALQVELDTLSKKK